MKLTNISVIQDLMKRHDMTFSKGLGQNFLINPSVSPRMAELAGVTKEHGVLEIGPGIGVLTKELAQRSKKVVAVELDQRLLPILAETLEEHDNVTIIHGDVLELDLHQLIREEFGDLPVLVCANLPYYITSPIIMKLLEERLPIESITAMVQKEAAQRISAPLPSREVGAITASIAYYAQSEILFPVSPGSFLPAPKVESSVLHLRVYTTPPIVVEKENDYFRVVKALFSQRRKTISNSLAAGLGIEKQRSNEILTKAEVPIGRRAEELTLEEFGRIANSLTAFEAR